MKLAHFTQPRRLLSIFVLLALLFLSAWSLFVNPDAGRLAGLINRYVLQERGLRLELQGPVQIHYWPHLDVRAEAFVVRHHDALLLEAGALQLQLPWSALIGKELVIKRLQLDQPRLWLVRDRQGRLNIASFLDAQGTTNRSVSLQQLDVHEGWIEYRDQERSWQLEALQWHTQAADPEPGMGKKSPQAVRGLLQLAARLSMADAAADTAQTPSADRDVRLQASINLASDYQLENTLHGPDLVLGQLDAQLQVEHLSGIAAATSAQTQLQTPFQARVQSRQLHIRWPMVEVRQLRAFLKREADAHRPSLDLNMQAEHLQWLEQQLQIPLLQFDARVKDRAGEQVQVNFAGRLQGDYPGQKLDVQKIDARLEWISSRWHEPLLLSLLGQAQLSAAIQEKTTIQAGLQFSGQLNGSPYSGQLQFAGRPHASDIFAKLEIKQLDLDRLLVKTPALDQRSSSSVASMEKMDYPDFQNSWQLELSIGQLQLNGLSIGQARLKFTERDLQRLWTAAGKTAR